jgi:hypothetical protein
LIPEINTAVKGEVKANCTQKRFEKHALIELGKHGKLINRIRFSPVATPNGIRIPFYCERAVVLSKSKDFTADMTQMGHIDTIKEINQAMDEYCLKHPSVKRSKNLLEEAVWKWKNHWVINIKLEVVIRNAEDIKSLANLTELAAASVFIFEQLKKLNSIYDQHLS